MGRGPGDPTVPPPPRRKLTPAALRPPPVYTERESQRPGPSPSPRPGLSSKEAEDFWQQLKRAEERGEERLQASLHALSDVYETKLRERDDEIERLKESSRQAADADITLQDAVLQLRKENAADREQTAAMVSTTVTAELSKRFPSNEETDDKIRGAGRLTQAKSIVGSVVIALVSSGALTAILKSCSDAPTVAPGAVQVTKPAASAIPGQYGSR